MGAFFVTALQHYLSGVGSWILVVTGAIFVIVVTVFRRGLVGEVHALWRRRGHAPSPSQVGRAERSLAGQPPAARSPAAAKSLS